MAGEALSSSFIEALQKVRDCVPWQFNLSIGLNRISQHQSVIGNIDITKLIVIYSSALHELSGLHISLYDPTRNKFC